MSCDVEPERKKLKSSDKVSSEEEPETEENTDSRHKMSDSESSQELFETPEAYDEDEESGVSWKGTPLWSLHSGTGTLPNLQASKYHTVMFKVKSANLEPFPAEYKDIWDGEHVRMPCSPENLYPCDTAEEKKLVPRWSLITRALRAPIRNSLELEEAILSFNTVYRHRWNFNGLHQFCSSILTEEESAHLFTSTIPGMAKLALDLPRLVTRPPPLLSRQMNHSISMSQKQIASLLANAFFCTFPRRNSKKSDSEFSSYPDINFNRLFFADRKKSVSARRVEKLKCLFHYFRRILRSDDDGGVVTFTRRYLAPEDLPKWSKVGLALPKLHICSKGMIENTGRDLLQVDFANKRVGGGVLGEGCVQEEIRFIICPELIVSRLFTEILDRTECLVIAGCEQYSEFSGYANSFEWKGNHQDATPRDSWCRRNTRIVAIDAVKFMRKEVQYREVFIDRELNKAYVGFVGPDDELSAVATGNWGCGAFRGDPHLKSLLQLMAAAVAGRDVAYFTFGSRELRDSIYQVYTFLTQMNVTVGELYQLLCRFSVNNRGYQDITEFIYATLTAYNTDTDVDTLEVTDECLKEPHSKSRRENDQSAIKQNDGEATLKHDQIKEILHQPEALAESSGVKPRDADTRTHEQVQGCRSKLLNALDDADRTQSQPKITQYFNQT